MAREWQETTLGILCDAGKVLIQTGPFGSQLHAYDYLPTGIPIIPTEAIGCRKLQSDNLPCVSPMTAQRLRRHRLLVGDILFARRGIQATGLSAVVTPEYEGVICGTGAILLRIISPEIDPTYLSFVLSTTEKIAWLKSHAVGAVMPNLNTEVLRLLPLLLPPLNEQRTITHILGALDDKIELNQKMNATLEAMVRALFKSWFVDFDPVRRNIARKKGDAVTGNAAYTELDALFPAAFEDSLLGQIPQGWQVAKVAELVKMSKVSLTPANYPDEFFDHYSIPAFDDSRLPKMEPGSAIQSNKFIVPSDAVLLSKLNPRIPRIWLPAIHHKRKSLCSTEFLVLQANPCMSREFLYSLFSSAHFIDVFTTLVTGTSGSHQRVKPEYLLAMNIVKPSTVVIQSFTKATVPMFMRIAANQAEMKTLAEIRNKLLPKLLSGDMVITDKY